MPIKVLLPPKTKDNAKAMKKIINDALDASAKAVTVDFRVTRQTWKHKPSFKTVKNGYNTFQRFVGTDDQQYIWVNNGTAPHIIRPHGKVLTWMGANYRAKTRPRVIGSSKGGNDNTIVYTKIVQHPGTAAREFDQAIAEKWQAELGVTMQRAIDSEVG